MSSSDSYPWIHPHFMPDGEGLVGVGGDLQPRTLIAAYTNGVFPWFEDSDPILWWSPDPRAIFEVDGLVRSKRLMRTYRSGKFSISFNRAFTDVMLGCADRDEGTWITSSMLEAYTELHRLGVTHSVEVWMDDALVGGLYGVAIRGFFAAESMFHYESDASKIAMVALFDRLQMRGYTLVDTQMLTDHTQRMGAIEIPRNDYLQRLAHALTQKQVTFVDPPSAPE
ncbi:leucyl/phenylalanyl-tRNA--protein transferase [Tuwongella immobilis]|uniref:Leucyl/phenylalanyl-tRNA--protein transferase n=1 Tax=Tuwongella immobilis TaxID=692036 RepID=A0A6C2YST7_9BACT|nr:leucyl/phenylalanyl-tRNA--protein transferase [Tuwongella immobilis]VIP04203.1 leucyl phenylalanyl-trna--protein transferase : Marine sediment metagenome DNA, contig: S01H1_L04343 OS=marine sediment metagenome GN=S01H1_12057 PE=3 SV=1: Leu_Phe_trans [Tuwongella immobilis]VTS05770.1 leucyl phenylalanyl-trna--protein transferase : Marine sediment metagenome DNA, contig: S01H1_L04343 OS=marine sediment metagenome GN=S01H1_12057 PE=3 SV=1: Leu_Phe_trans [Tuwongella immobilis]